MLANESDHRPKSFAGRADSETARGRDD